MEDENNFTIKVGNFNCQMIDGELCINDCGYEVNEDDPTYELVREIWRMRNATI